MTDPIDVIRRALAALADIDLAGVESAAIVLEHDGLTRQASACLHARTAIEEARRILGDR